MQHFNTGGKTIIALFALAFAPVVLVSAHSQASSAQVRDHRETSTNEQNKARDHRIGTIFLDNSECTALGGKVQEIGISVCGSGEFCSREDAEGETHRVCISKNKPASQSTSGQSTPRTPPRRGGSTQVQRIETVSVKPLTSAQCVGLGGVQTRYAACASKSSCSTTDAEGVIRVICIDKAAK